MYGNTAKGRQQVAPISPKRQLRGKEILKDSTDVREKPKSYHIFGSSIYFKYSSSHFHFLYNPSS